jgi:D-methionine transport system ATP-binding protein
MIELVNVSKTYPNGVTAIENVNFKINDGEIFGIIGLSGAGKSTLVRCINALEKPSTGQVLIDNEDLGKLNDKDLNHMRMRIGMIFQNYALLEQRTVFNNVRFPLELNRTNKIEADKKVKALLELVGLSDKASAYPSQLSGGQKQR